MKHQTHSTGSRRMQLAGTDTAPAPLVHRQLTPLPSPVLLRAPLPRSRAAAFAASDGACGRTGAATSALLLLLLLLAAAAWPAGCCALLPAALLTSMLPPLSLLPPLLLLPLPRRGVPVVAKGSCSKFDLSKSFVSMHHCSMLSAGLPAGRHSGWVARFGVEGEWVPASDRQQQGEQLNAAERVVLRLRSAGDARAPTPAPAECSNPSSKRRPFPAGTTHL